MHDFVRFMRHAFRLVYFIRGIVLAFATLLLICVLLIVLAEGMPLGKAVYFVLITATTVGYGDITPSTTLGRVVSVAAGMAGVLATGILVAVAVRALGQAFQEKMRDQHQEQ
jgi:voltage-gated potassium channel